MRVIEVAIADDDAAFREALCDVLEADPRFSVVGVASSGQEMAEILAHTGADVVLLDVRMPGGGPLGAQVLAAVTHERRHPPAIVALSAQAGVGTVLAMVRAGASGYLVKGRAGSDLPELITRVAAGEVVLAVPTAGEAVRRLALAARLPPEPVAPTY